ncbi:MAG TPA: AraC family transcriptional regulator [Burkholderiaceae bacterium]|jgi:AraC-like DNA-binding protein|nr:AraC family transcriptional regulator [Burkholderiaceae bacterium]
MLNESATAEIAPTYEAHERLDSELEELQRELTRLLDRLTHGREGAVESAVPGLSLYRILRPSGPTHAVQTPALGLIAQGSKQLLVGDELYEYDPGHYLVTSVDLPVVVKRTVASPSKPYLGLRLALDVGEIGELIGHDGLPAAHHEDASRGLYVHRLGPSMLDAVVRLLRLLESPQDIPILAPLIKREILYRLLTNGPGERLRQIALRDSNTRRIATAIRLLRGNFSEKLRVETLARNAHMSVSSLQHHFKAVTALSPLQYQKQLRLHEARRLLFTGDIDVSIVAQRVGYGSASQFSREYGRLFGASPLRDRRRWAAGGGAE